ncbi:19074_t:CDS:2 [Racocetra fulgida]|uniref:19074_t:CDS:1 n=1 Tax=Racocetra fulgida TaxID=60492 RepID=A0A9N8W0N2_9GLOM|nr:19074_t:CDS:2 [Racocetra fulgida]
MGKSKSDILSEEQITTGLYKLAVGEYKGGTENNQKPEEKFFRINNPLIILARHLPYGIKKMGFVSNVPDAQLLSYNDINFEEPISEMENYRIPKYYFIDELNFTVEGRAKKQAEGELAELAEKNARGRQGKKYFSWPSEIKKEEDFSATSQPAVANPPAPTKKEEDKLTPEEKPAPKKNFPNHRRRISSLDDFISNYLKKEKGENDA